MDTVESRERPSVPPWTLRENELLFVEERFRKLLWEYERGRAVADGHHLDRTATSMRIAHLLEELKHVPFDGLLFLGEVACAMTAPQPHNDDHYRSAVLRLLDSARCPDLRLTRALRDDIVPGITFVTRWCFLV